MIIRHREDVEFQTLDGCTLRGWLFPAAERGPAVIMSPGFNCVKEMLLPEVATSFQAAGITALVYDTRSIGSSDGLPRNDINPPKQVADYHDAVTYMRTHPLVNPVQIALWGYSLSAMVALSATALDKRVAAVIACAPPTSVGFPPEKLPKILARVQKDRESCIAGNPPCQVPLFDKKGNTLFKIAVPISEGDHDLIRQAQAYGPTVNITTSMQSYYHIAMWDPSNLMPLVSPTPVMMCVAEEDGMCLFEEEKKLFEGFREPKLFHSVPNKGHMDFLTGEEFPHIMEAQIEFLKQHMG
ncbi:DltD N-terminal domain protein [Dactylonectria estremocensis]|uniref:DltD N-terminal domain protein n=1 Tax=Dactylonectria estremocensis TaxID=1079267 RepID=A0A9P9FCC3_9HYPO|nr:DltD N-terminal domain protein [Dactylonectria estremocensis]